MCWAATQAQFYDTLRQPELLAPVGLVRADGNPVTTRFNVYRNNITTSLIEAMRDGFPMVTRLVGVEYFDALAQIYVQNHLPQSPVMLYYGDSFADFLAHFPPLSDYPYMSDVAALEFAQRCSLHASDHRAFVPPHDTTNWLYAPLSLAPATQWMTSQYPLYDFWYHHYQDENHEIVFAPQDILLTRHDNKLRTHLMPSGGVTFFDALRDGSTPQEACTLAQATQVEDNAVPHQYFTQLFALALAAAQSTEHSE